MCVYSFTGKRRLIEPARITLHMKTSQDILANQKQETRSTHMKASQEVNIQSDTSIFPPPPILVQSDVSIFPDRASSLATDAINKNKETAGAGQ